MVMLKLLYNLPHLNLWGMTLRAQIHIFFFVRGILFLEFYNVNLNLNLNFPRGGGPPSPYGAAHAGLFFIYFFRGEWLFFPLSVCELLFKYPVHHISWMLSVRQIFFSFPMFIDIHVHVDTWNISACEECKTSVVCRL